MLGLLEVRLGAGLGPVVAAGGGRDPFGGSFPFCGARPFGGGLLEGFFLFAIHSEPTTGLTDNCVDQMVLFVPERANALGYRLRFIGSKDLLPPALSAAAKQAEERSESHPRKLTIALGYGGRQEIVDATRELVRYLAEAASPDEDIAARITPEAIAEHLYAADIPDPDLVIRTSGESRLSGFLLWQAAYSEYSFVDVYWPAFRRVDFLRELRNYTQRERRFGQ